MDPRQLLDHIIRPALMALGASYATEPACILLLATSAQETLCGQFVRQMDGGPALGIYQMEPPTYGDTVRRSVRHLPPGPHDVTRLVHDNRYATQVARLKYALDPEPLPAVEVGAMWATYKRVWNTPLGAATEDQFGRRWAHFVAPLL